MNDLFQFFKENNIELKPFFNCDKCKDWFNTGKKLIAEKETELQSLKQQLKEARLVIKYYESEQTWLSHGFNKKNVIEDSDLIILNSFGHEQGGKRAQTYLSKHPETKEEI